jgi:hypothetical protein
VKGLQQQSFQVLYAFLVSAHDRRRILDFNVTAHPTEEWTGQQLREAFPFDQLPRYLMRDRDAIFGNAFTEQMREMDIEEGKCGRRGVHLGRELTWSGDWFHSARVPRSRNHFP